MKRTTHYQFNIGRFMTRVKQYQLLIKDGLKSEFGAMETWGDIKDCMTTTVYKELIYGAAPYTVGDPTSYQGLDRFN